MSFLTQIPALSLPSKTPPQKPCFFHYCLHISHPFVLSSYSEMSYFWFPYFVFTFSPSPTAGETLSYLLSSTAHQETSLEEKKKCLVYTVQQPTSLSTASFHPTLCAGQATQVTTPVCFPPSPTELQMLRHTTDIHFALLHTLLPLQVPGHSRTSLQPAPPHCLPPPFSTAYTCTSCRFLLQVKPQTSSLTPSVQ